MSRFHEIEIHRLNEKGVSTLSIFMKMELNLM